MCAIKYNAGIKLYCCKVYYTILVTARYITQYTGIYQSIKIYRYFLRTIAVTMLMKVDCNQF